MQSRCLKEVSQVYFTGCCPSPILGFPEALNKVNKTSSTTATCRRNFAATTTSFIFPNTQFTDPDSLPPLEESFNGFISAYPQYHETYQVDQIRTQEYCHLSLSNHTCLDYIGIGLFSESQLHQDDSEKQIVSSSSYSPPPSALFSSQHIPFFGVSYKTGNLKTQLLHGGQESDLETAMKKRIMNFLHISEDDYCMVFTANRTSAFKILAESYPFQSSRELLTVYDYESEAVEAMVTSSEKKGARVMSAEFSWPRLRIHSAKLKKLVERKNKKKKRGLFVFPLHSRVTGARYPYLWMSKAAENGWNVLIDVCALGPKDMDSFGLSLLRPDFLICSFYKIFGENPSGFGCLFVKKSAVPLLEDCTAAGMVSLVPATELFSLLDESSSDTGFKQASTLILEEGKLSTSNTFSSHISSEIVELAKLEGETSEFQTGGTTAKQKPLISSDIIEPEKPADAIQQERAKTKRSQILEIECRGLDQIDLLGMSQISSRARCLINWLVTALTKLKHPNTEEMPLIRIYGPKIKFDRGPALAFNIFDWKGEKVEAALVQKLADRSNISLSYSFLHHIFFSDKYEEGKTKFLENRSRGSKGQLTNKRAEKTELGITVVTVALGFLANFEDTYRLWAFIAQFLDADFVEKAKWRYTALNQKIIDV